MADSFQIPFEGGNRFTARHYAAAEPARQLALVLAHGAGVPQQSPFMVTFARGLSARGFDVVTFDFPYMDAGRRVPDPPARLQAAFGAVLDAVADGPLGGHGLLAGGKSLGGRMATHLAAGGGRQAARIRGVVLLGYPLHPPGQASKIRAAHLPEIRVPVLFLQGTRDAFGTPGELAATGMLPPHATVVPVEGGDHSFKVPKGWPTPQNRVYEEAMDSAGQWAGAALLKGSGR